MAQSDTLIWTHQYANYLNYLYDELLRYGEINQIGLLQMNDIISCVPHWNLEKEYQGYGIWSLMKY